MIGICQSVITKQTTWAFPFLHNKKRTYQPKSANGKKAEEGSPKIIFAVTYRYINPLCKRAFSQPSLSWYRISSANKTVRFHQQQRGIHCHIIISLRETLKFFLPSICHYILPYLVSFLLPTFTITVFIEHGSYLCTTVQSHPTHHFG